MNKPLLLALLIPLNISAVDLFSFDSNKALWGSLASFALSGYAFYYFAERRDVVKEQKEIFFSQYQRCLPKRDSGSAEDLELYIDAFAKTLDPELTSKMKVDTSKPRFTSLAKALLNIQNPNQQTVFDKIATIPVYAGRAINIPDKKYDSVCDVAKKGAAISGMIAASILLHNLTRP